MVSLIGLDVELNSVVNSCFVVVVSRSVVFLVDSSVTTSLEVVESIKMDVVSFTGIKVTDEFDRMASLVVDFKVVSLKLGWTVVTNFVV